MRGEHARAVKGWEGEGGGVRPRRSLSGPEGERAGRGVGEGRGGLVESGEWWVSGFGIADGRRSTEGGGT